MDRRMGGCVSGLMMGAKKDGRTDRQMVGWMDRTGGQVNGRERVRVGEGREQQ